MSGPRRCMTWISVEPEVGQCEFYNDANVGPPCPVAQAGALGVLVCWVLGVAAALAWVVKGMLGLLGLNAKKKAKRA